MLHSMDKLTDHEFINFIIINHRFYYMHQPNKQENNIHFVVHIKQADLDL